VPRHADVAVVIPCFNHGRFLGEAVASALGQSGGPPRVVVVDDGSTEPDTERALGELPDGVQLVRQANVGPAAARNAGIEATDTPLVTMLDADDRMTPDAIDTLRGPLEAHPDVGYCYGVMRLFGEWSGDLRFPHFDPYKLLYRPIAGASLGLIRRVAWEQAGRFDPEIGGYEDWDFCMSALEAGWRGLQVDAVTLEYRKHERSGNAEHRSEYRRTYRRLRAKHAALFARSREFAAETDLGPAGRLLYRTYFAWRPVPARVEQALYSKVVFRRREAGGSAA
jgi:glycosyltransferase involved in cell wall biosynthesis